MAIHAEQLSLGAGIAIANFSDILGKIGDLLAAAPALSLGIPDPFRTDLLARFGYRDQPRSGTRASCAPPESQRLTPSPCWNSESYEGRERFVCELGGG